MRPSALLLSLAVWCGAPFLPAAAPAQPETQAEAEERLAALLREIESVRTELSRARAAHREGQEALRDTDLAIQESTRQLRQLDRAKADHLDRLRALEEERDQERERIRAREHELASQLAATYRLARQSRLKLVLNQDDPVQLARLLAFHERINRAQAERVESLRASLRRLETLLMEIDGQIMQIDALRKAESETLDLRQRQRAERAGLLEQLSVRIGGEEARLAELERDRADLERLLERLSDVLADIPDDLGRQDGLGGAKGRLPMPVEARVRFAFGQPRTAGLRWQGWLLAAQTGAEVRSVGYGRVAFADWFRGYGLMMIIDHGQGFMSLYGYNESLLWDVGDWVEPGAVIATVGEGPGGEQGLYFELRHDGRPIDPAAWVAR